MEMIIDTAEDSSHIQVLALHLLREKNVDKKNAGQRGILEALLCKMDDVGLDNILKTEFVNRSHILLWGVAFCLYASRSRNLAFLKIRARRIYKILSSESEGKKPISIKELLSYWNELVRKYVGNEKENLDMHFYELYRDLII